MNNKQMATAIRIITGYLVGNILVNGIMYFARQNNTTPQPPKIEEYRENNTAIELKVLGRTLLEDFDKDGNVDAITLLPNGPMQDRWKALYVTKEYERYGQLRESVFLRKEFPEKIRDLASKLMKDSQHLSFAIAQDEHDIYTNKTQSTK